jgi:hypothetical protein
VPPDGRFFPEVPVMSSPSTPSQRDRFVPRLEVLEDRLAAAMTSPALDLTIVLPAPVVFEPAPSTGGVAVQIGSSLRLGLASMPSPSATLILTDGLGDVAIAWDGGPFQFFSGVSAVEIFSHASSNLVGFDLLTSPQQQQVTATLFNGPQEVTFPLAAGGEGFNSNPNMPVSTFVF